MGERESFVRWGFDAAHRSSSNSRGSRQTRGRSGIDRILLGVTMAEDGHVSSAPRSRSTTSTAATSSLRGVGRVPGALAGRPRRTGWLPSRGGVGRQLAAIADSLRGADTGRRLATRRSSRRCSTSWSGRRTEDDMASAVALGCDDIRSLLPERLKGRPTRANFRTGHLTVCTLVPMRSIPHRVVCLLGLDDGSFPRHVERDGDDLTARHPRVGDRDARSEDRQLLLDALLAARDHLVDHLFSGHDERSNLPPPARRACRRAARRRGAHGADPDGTRPRCHCLRAPSAAFRQAQLRARAARAGPALEFRRAPPGRRPRRPGTTTSDSAVPRAPVGTMPAPVPRARSAGSLPAPPRAGRSCANGSGSGCGTGPATSRTPSRSTRTDWSDGRSPTGSCGARLDGAGSTHARRPRAPGERCHRGRWPSRS